MGRQETLGTLSPGKAADLVVLKADPAADIRNMRQAVQVMRAGVLRSLEELRPGDGR
jgi:imidazolonepropionase-like amidohydrolase